MGYASSSRSVRSARSHAPPGTWPPPRGRVAVPVVAAPSVPCRPPTAEVFWSGNLPPQAPSGDALPCRRRLLVRPMVRRPSQRVKFPHSPVQWSSETNKYRIESFQCAQRNLDRTLSIVIYSRSGIRSADFIGILTWVGVELGLAAEDPTHSRRAWDPAQQQVNPPSIGRHTPEIIAAPSPSRNTMGAAISSSVAQRCNGICFRKGSPMSGRPQ